MCRCSAKRCPWRCFHNFLPAIASFSFLKQQLEKTGYRFLLRAEHFRHLPACFTNSSPSPHHGGFSEQGWLYRKHIVPGHVLAGVDLPRIELKAVITHTERSPMFVLWSNDTFESKVHVRFIFVMSVVDRSVSILVRRLRRTNLVATRPKPATRFRLIPVSPLAVRLR